MQTNIDLRKLQREAELAIKRINDEADRVEREAGSFHEENWEHYTGLIREYVVKHVRFGSVLVDHIAFISQPENFQEYSLNEKMDRTVHTKPSEVYFLLPNCTPVSILVRAMFGNMERTIQRLAFDGDYYNRWSAPDEDGKYPIDSFLFRYEIGHEYCRKDEEDHPEWQRGEWGEWGVYAGNYQKVRYAKTIELAVGLAGEDYVHAELKKEDMRKAYELRQAKWKLHLANEAAEDEIKRRFSLWMRMQTKNTLPSDGTPFIHDEDAKHLMMANLIIALQAHGQTPY